MFKKAISARKKMPSWIKWILISFATWIFFALLDSLINKEALFNSLSVRIPLFLLRMKIPASIFLLAFAAVALSLWSLNKRIKNIKTMSHKRELSFANNAYWVMSVGLIAPQGPFCPKCYADDKEIRMINTYVRMNEVKCPVCGLTTISSEPSFNKQIFGR